MPLTRFLLYALSLAPLSLLPAAAAAHPATGIVVDARGRLAAFRPAVRGRHVRELSPGGTLKVLASVGLKENVAARMASSCDAGAEADTADEYEKNVERVERALGIYYGLGVVAIGAVAGLQGIARRSGRA